MMNTDQLLGALAEQIKKLRARAETPGALGSMTTLTLRAYGAGRKRGLAEGWKGAAERMQWVLDEATRTQPEPDTDIAPGEVIDWHQSRRHLWELVEAERKSFCQAGREASAEAVALTVEVEAHIRAMQPRPPLRRRLGAWLLHIGSQLSVRGAS